MARSNLELQGKWGKWLGQVGQVDLVTNNVETRGKFAQWVGNGRARVGQVDGASWLATSILELQATWGKVVGAEESGIAGRWRRPLGGNVDLPDLRAGIRPWNFYGYLFLAIP